MATTWRPPPGTRLGEQVRRAAYLTGRSANEILNEAAIEWLDRNKAKLDAMEREASAGAEP